MKNNTQILTFRLNTYFLYTLRTLLLIGAMYFFASTFRWMVFEKYQNNGNIRGLDLEVDKQLGLDKTTDLSLEYEQAWINSEKKYNNTLGVLCIIFYIIIMFFEPENTPSKITKTEIDNK